jgi:hypothetical protein
VALRLDLSRPDIPSRIDDIVFVFHLRCERVSRLSPTQSKSRPSNLFSRMNFKLFLANVFLRTDKHRTVTVEQGRTRAHHVHVTGTFRYVVESARGVRPSAKTQQNPQIRIDFFQFQHTFVHALRTGCPSFHIVFFIRSNRQTFKYFAERKINVRTKKWIDVFRR